jgi:hypothetical protein
MHSLREVIQVLRRQLSGAEVSPKAARVTLQLVLQDTGGEPEFRVLSSTDRDYRGPVHTLTIDLSASAPADVPAPVREDTPAPAPSPQSLHEALVLLFGPPGFDNAARSTVFREALEELAQEERTATIESLANAPSETALRPAAVRILRVLKLGPAGAVRGPAVLRQVWQQFGGDAVLRTLQEEWKTQSEWVEPSQPE